MARRFSVTLRAVDKATVLHRLAEDNPAFHYISEDAAVEVVAAGFPITAGEFNLSVCASVLQWIADHVTEDMNTIETGAGQTTVLFAALAKHHYCCTFISDEVRKIRGYLQTIGVPTEKVTFLEGSSDRMLAQLSIDEPLDFAFVDGCHGYPFPALDWHYIDQRLKVGGILGMDNAELRPVREHCEFLEENGSYRRVELISIGDYNVRFYEKLRDENREWAYQKYSIPKKSRLVDDRLLSRIRRRVAGWLDPA